MNHSETYFAETGRIAAEIDDGMVETLARELGTLRERGGRIFVLGVGGGAANACHAVNNFRKLCGIEDYAPTDNVCEQATRTSGDGWDTVFAAWLETSRANDRDAVFVLSVGGGNLEKNMSAPIWWSQSAPRRSAC